MDNPRYTVRPNAEFGADPRQPLRIIIDAKARLHPQLEIFQQGGPVLIATLEANQQSLAETFRHADLTMDVEVISVLADDRKRVDLPALLKLLATQYDCQDLMIEAGGQLSGAFVQADLVDEFVIYQAPTLLGHEGKACYYLNIPTLEAQKKLKISAYQKVGEDMRLTATFVAAQ